MAKELSVVDNAVHFGEKLAASGTFKTLFRDGMALVEETAAYLDGAGRDDAKTLQRATALAYASESMRLTTRLMQIASWLLLQRAINEGEMSRPRRHPTSGARVSPGRTSRPRRMPPTPCRARFSISSTSR